MGSQRPDDSGSATTLREGSSTTRRRKLVSGSPGSKTPPAERRPTCRIRLERSKTGSPNVKSPDSGRLWTRRPSSDRWLSSKPPHAISKRESSTKSVETTCRSIRRWAIPRSKSKTPTGATTSPIATTSDSAVVEPPQLRSLTASRRHSDKEARSTDSRAQRARPRRRHMCPVTGFGLYGSSSFAIVELSSFSSNAAIASSR
jgi:hypothetical protein